jgi:hypothetical protein
LLRGRGYGEGGLESGGDLGGGGLVAGLLGAGEGEGRAEVDAGEKGLAGGGGEEVGSKLPRMAHRKEDSRAASAAAPG